MIKLEADYGLIENFFFNNISRILGAHDLFLYYLL